MTVAPSPTYPVAQTTVGAYTSGGGSSVSASQVDQLIWDDLDALGTQMQATSVSTLHPHAERYAVQRAYGDINSSILEIGGTRYWMSAHGGTFTNPDDALKSRCTRATLPSDGSYDLVSDVAFAVVQNVPTNVFEGNNDTETRWAGAGCWHYDTGSGMALGMGQFEYLPIAPAVSGHWRQGLVYSPNITDPDGFDVYFLGFIYDSQTTSVEYAPQIGGPFVVSKDGLWLEIYGYETTSGDVTYPVTRHRLNIADAVAWAEANYAGAAETPIVAEKWSSGAWVPDSGLANDVAADNLMGKSASGTLPADPEYMHFYDVARVPAISEDCLLLIAPYDEFNGSPFDVNGDDLTSDDWSLVAHWSYDDGVTWTHMQQILPAALHPIDGKLTYSSLAAPNRVLESPVVDIISTKQPASGNAWDVDTSFIKTTMRPRVVSSAAALIADLEATLGEAAYLDASGEGGDESTAGTVAAGDHDHYNLPRPVALAFMFDTTIGQIGGPGLATTFGSSFAANQRVGYFRQTDDPGTYPPGVYTMDADGEYILPATRLDTTSSDQVNRVFNIGSCAFALSPQQILHNAEMATSNGVAYGPDIYFRPAQVGYAYRTVDSGTYVVLPDDKQITCTDTSTIHVPDLSAFTPGPGNMATREYTVSNVSGAATVTITTPTGTDVVDTDTTGTDTSYALAAGDTVRVVSTGDRWLVLA